MRFMVGSFLNLVFTISYLRFKDEKSDPKFPLAEFAWEKPP